MDYLFMHVLLVCTYPFEKMPGKISKLLPGILIFFQKL